MKFHGDATNMYRQILINLREIHNDGLPWEEIACLYKRHATMNKLTTHLQEFRIPYTILGDNNNLKDSKTKKVINLLNCLVNPLDTKSFSIAAETTSTDNRHRLPSNIVSSINRIAQDSNTNLVEASKLFMAASTPKSNIRRNLMTFITAYENLQDMMAQTNTNLFNLCRRANSLIHESDNYGMMMKPEQEFAQILTISQSTPRLSKESPKDHLSRFLELLAIAQDPEHRSKDNDNPFAHNTGLTFCTIHAAKGLQWTVVGLIDAIDAHMPGANADRPDNLLEEQRLFYVACTRATDQLYFYHHESSEYSRFIDAIQNDLYREEIELPSTSPDQEVSPR